MPPFRLVSDYQPKGDQPGAIQQLSDWIAAGRPHTALLGVTGSRQDLHGRLGHRAAPAADARHVAQQDAGRPALRRVPGASSRRTPSSTSSPTTTTTSPRRTSRSRTRTSRRTRSSTTRSTGCATRRPSPSSSGATWSSWRRSRASTASARPRPTTGCTCRWPRARSGSGTTSCGSWSRSSTSATTTTSTAARSASAATSSRSSRPRTRAMALRIELFGDTVEAIHRIDPLKGAVLERVDRAVRLPGQPLRHAGRACSRARGVDQGRAGRAADVPPGPEPPARGAAARAAHAVRPGDAPGDRVLPRHRELLPPPGRPPGGGDPRDADRLPARRTPWW